MTCPACGHDGDAADRFCASCGAPLPADVDGAVEHTGSITSIIPTSSGPASGPITAVGSDRQRDLPAGSALLVVHRGPVQGQEFVLDGAIDVLTVGRAPESEIFLDDVTVSRRHAEFRHGAEGWSVRDVGSLNGTYVNRVRVEDRRLAGGDEVQIGKFRFVVLLGPDTG